MHGCVCVHTVFIYVFLVFIFVQFKWQYQVYERMGSYSEWNSVIVVSVGAYYVRVCVHICIYACA